MGDFHLQDVPFAELVTVPRDEPAVVAIDVRERAKPVVFDFEQPVGMIESLGDATSGIGRMCIKFSLSVVRAGTTRKVLGR